MNLVWKQIPGISVHYAYVPASHGTVFIRRLRRQWVIQWPESPAWRNTTAENLRNYKGQPRYATLEGAKAACRLVYG